MRYEQNTTLLLSFESEHKNILKLASSKIYTT